MVRSKFNPSTLRKAMETRKKMKQQDKMNYLLKIRFTKEQREELENAAKAVGMCKTAYCRSRILGHRIRDMTPETRKFRNIIINGCNNINQIAHHLNKTGMDDEAIAAIHDMLQWFRQLKSLAFQDNDICKIFTKK